MLHAIRVCIQVLFPERGDAHIVRSIDISDLHSISRTTMHTDTTALLPFRDARVRACIHEAKFHDNERACSLLGAVLATHLSKFNDPIVIPIPLSSARQRARGYNQVTQIIEAARTHMTVHIYDEILYKQIDTVPQTSLSKKERLTNVRDAFAVYDTTQAHKRIHGRHVILIDDVTTTGATFAAAKAALLPHRPATVTCIALAH